MGKRTQGDADNLKIIPINDFSAGVNSMWGNLALDLKESLVGNQPGFGTQNAIGFPGRALYVGGFMPVSTFPVNNPDNAYEFYDSANARHQMVWAAGNLYEVTTGAWVLVAAAVYTAGDPVGVIDQAGICYYTSPHITGLQGRQFDGAVEQAIPGADFPAGTYLTAFAGSILIANPHNAGHGNNPSSFVPTAVNTPSTTLWADMQTVGTDYGGIIAFIMPMGVSSTGIPATKSILVGKTAGNLFMYTGAVGSQQEAIVNCPVGCLDGMSAVYIPAPTLFGQVIFLGNDAQLWGCDGVIAEPLTQDKNQDYVFGLVSNARIINPGHKFTATYNKRFSYYLIDMGLNQQLIWMWRTKALYPVNGWPSGIYFSGHDVAGFAANFVAATAFYANGIYQVGQDFTTFNGVNPVISYQTPFLHGGNAELTKEWVWACLSTRNLGATYKVVAQTLPDANGNSYSSIPLLFPDAAATANLGYGYWDQAFWDQNVQWAPDPITALPDVKHGMLAVPVPASPWVPQGATQPLRSGAISFIISWQPEGSAPPAFDLNLFQVRYSPRSMRTSGNAKYIASTGIPITGVDPFNGRQT